MNPRKPPQERSTPKRIEAEEGWPDTMLKFDRHSVSVWDLGDGDRFPPVLRGREQVEAVRDYLDAWLDHDAEEVADDE